MKIVHLKDRDKKPAEMEGARAVWKQLPLGTVDGVANFSFRVFTIEPDGHTPYHEHPSEHLNYVISGQGCLVDAEGKEHPLGEGSFAFVSPGEKHQYRNRADAPFVMICAVPKEYE